MSKPRRTALVATLLVVVLALFAASSTLFAAQGGFGAGHGRFDRALLVFGLPWLLIPWPESSWVSVYVMIVLLPLACNLAVVLVLLALHKRQR
jgi:hypothetical protein